jgi:hypothetical protein
MTAADPHHKPDLVVHPDDLTETARELALIMATSGHLYNRSGPVKVITQPGSALPEIRPLSVDRIVVEAHELARPVKVQSTPKPTTLPDRVAKLYLALDDWGLPQLKGITTAPLLLPDGSMRVAQGYDPRTGMWCCCNAPPKTEVPDAPTFDDAQTALLMLRAAFCTFPFADAETTRGPNDAVPLVDRSSSAGQDESAFLTGLLTAVCRPSLPLAPGLLISAPVVSGAGTGKGLLVRAICEIAFAYAPYALHNCGSAAEFEKRIGAALIEAAPVLFLDNLNDAALRGDLLASALTEAFVKVRPLGFSRLLPLNPTAFVAVTGNGVLLSEDLVRRFIAVELDARTDDPESRPFAPGFLGSISARRTELLSAALTIWRWGRQNERTILRGHPLGSYEIWGRWVRDPLLALGCADPVKRIAQIKARDPLRQRNAVLFKKWWACHSNQPVSAAELHEELQRLIDPHGRGRQFIALALTRLTGTRAAGFVLTQQKPVGRWGRTTYALEAVEPDQENPDAPMTPMPWTCREPNRLEGWHENTWIAWLCHRGHRGHRTGGSRAPRGGSNVDLQLASRVDGEGSTSNLDREPMEVAMQVSEQMVSVASWAMLDWALDTQGPAFAFSLYTRCGVAPAHASGGKAAYPLSMQ